MIAKYMLAFYICCQIFAARFNQWFFDDVPADAACMLHLKLTYFRTHEGHLSAFPMFILACGGIMGDMVYFLNDILFFFVSNPAFQHVKHSRVLCWFDRGLKIKVVA